MTGLGRRAARAAGGAALTLRVRPANARAAQAITFVTPFNFILAFADVLVARSGGFFEREGLAVTIEQGRGSAMAVQQVLGGNALLSRTGGTDHIKAVAGQGAPPIAVGTIAQASPFYVISHADKPIRGPAEGQDDRHPLAGRRLPRTCSTSCSSRPGSTAARSSASWSATRPPGSR